MIELMLEKMSLSGEVEISEFDENLNFLIKTREAGLLIGENGQNLIALAHLLKKMADVEFKKNNLEKIQFFIDVNGYQLKRIEELKNLARTHAQRVRYFKKEIMMDPMNAYERRIIHSVLTEYPDIITESTGEDPERCVVIKPFLIL